MKHHIVIDARIRRSSTGRPIAHLLEQLQQLDTYNDYTLLLQPDDDWRPTAANFRVVPCPFPQFSLNPLNDIRFAWLLYHLKPDLVHFTMTQQPLLYFGNIVTMTHDLTMFHYVRRGNTPAPLFWLKMQLYHFLMWQAHHKSRRIIVPTHTTAREVAEFQPFTKEKLAVTLEAVGVPQHLTPQKPAGLPAKFVMYLGTAFPHKNLPALVAAFDSIADHYSDLHLVLIGKKEKHYEELEQQLPHYKAGKRVIITGFLPDEQSKWAYQHCQVFVTPSLAEGFGLPALEAMAYGAPVISSNTSVMPEVYGEGALYCDPHDPQDIAAKISTVLDDPALRKNLIKKGAAQVKKYSWRRMAEETLTVYKDVLGD